MTRGVRSGGAQQPPVASVALAGPGRHGGGRSVGGALSSSSFAETASWPSPAPGRTFRPPIQVLKHEDAQLWGGNPAMLGPSASLVIIVYGERHSHALGSKRPFLLSDCRQVTGSGIRKPGPQAPLFPYLSSLYMLYPKLK